MMGKDTINSPFLCCVPQVETLVEGPHGARMIHTGPDPRLQESEQGKQFVIICSQ